MTERLKRRDFIATGIAAGAVFAAGPSAATTEESAEFELNAAPAKTNIVGGDYPDTMAWTYNGAVMNAIKSRAGDLAPYTNKTI